jgi:AraC-like DNA-binding protein
MRKNDFRRMTGEATLRVGGARAFLQVLTQLGEDPVKLLADSGIDPALFDDPDNLITYRARGRFIALGAIRTGCPHFGLLGGELMNLNSLGLVGLLAKNSTDVRTALQSLVGALHLHSPGAAMHVVVDGDVAMLTYDSVQPRSEGTDHVGDAAVAMMQNVMRTLCGKDFRPVGAWFAHRRPKDIREFSRFFRVPLTFDAAHYALLFARRWLDFRLPDFDPELMRLLRKQAHELQVKHGERFPDTVRSVLRSSLLTGHASADEVAALFMIHRRTLTRRLGAYGVNFQNLVDEKRFEIARQMLQDTSLDIGEIAASLGYARTSPFSRAFRRWSGTTPAAWRARRPARA